MQQDNDLKHTANATKDLIWEKKWKVSDWPSRSPDLNHIENAFHLLERSLKGKNPPKQTTTERSCSLKSGKATQKKKATVW